MLLYFPKFPLKASMILYWGKAQNYVLKKESLVLMVGWGDTVKKNKQKKKRKNRPRLSFSGCQQPCLSPVSPSTAAGTDQHELGEQGGAANSGTLFPCSGLTQQN